MLWSAYKKILCTLLLFFIWHLFHAKTKPSFFAGAGGQLGFPSFSIKPNGLSGFGGGGYLEGGLEIAGFQTEIIASFMRLSGGSGLLEHLNETKIGLGAAYVLSRSTVRFLPGWLSFRPHISGFADIYTARVYKNSVQKEEGTLSSVRGVTPSFNAGLFIDFPNLIAVKNQQIDLTVGFEEAFRFDKSSGVYATPIVNIGARIVFAPLPKTGIVTQQEAPMKDASAEIRPDNDPQKPIAPMEAQPKKAPETEHEQPMAPEPETLPNPLPQTPIELPVILFAPYSVALTDGSARERQEQSSALETIARILQEHPEYRVKILGYANSVTDDPAENETELIPLSQKRAEAVMADLETRGIAKERMESDGMGSGPFSKADGRKNRRVEFVLIPAR